MSEITGGYQMGDRVEHAELGRGIVFGIGLVGMQVTLTVLWNSGSKTAVPHTDVSAVPRTEPMTEDEARGALVARDYERAEVAFAKALELSAARKRGGRDPGLLPEDTPTTPVEEPKPEQLGLFDVAAPVIRTHRRSPYGDAR